LARLTMFDLSDPDHPDLEQEAAIKSTDRAIAVLAGPGSGKTRVLSRRARELLTRNPDEHVLLLTFTNKAAAEMKARAMRALPVPTDHLWAGTFHTFGLRLLSAHGELVDAPRTFEILDDEERPQFVDEVCQVEKVANAYARWSFLRLRRLGTTQAGVAAFGAAYQKAKRDAGLLDFDDLVVLTADLLEQNPDVPRAYASRYPNLLVDEFQDTNAAQFAIIRALAVHCRTIGVFADDDQAIYRFAGAEAANVRSFIEELGATQYPLTTNYRCRGEIVARANRLISADPNASGRQMRAYYPGGTVRLRQFIDTATEAAVLAKEIGDLITPQTRASDVAVLGRGAFRLTPLLSELRRAGVPVTSWLSTTTETRERRAVRTCLAIVRGELSPYQSRRLSDFIGIPEVGSNPITILASDPGNPRLEALAELRDSAWRGDSPAKVLQGVRTVLLAVDTTFETAIDTMIAEVAELEAADAEFTVEHLLADLALGSVGAGPTVGGGVKVASLHRTKGLQWRHVYVVGLEEGRLPFYKAESDEEIREERRLCFVGVCRAKEHLTLTKVATYANRTLRPSRFLTDLGFYGDLGADRLARVT
jgi:DNA helicase-2/ATP-dependent DNA helicase PcrA